MSMKRKSRTTDADGRCGCTLYIMWNVEQFANVQAEIIIIKWMEQTKQNKIEWTTDVCAIQQFEIICFGKQITKLKLSIYYPKIFIHTNLFIIKTIKIHKNSALIRMTIRRDKNHYFWQTKRPNWSRIRLCERGSHSFRYMKIFKYHISVLRKNATKKE